MSAIEQISETNNVNFVEQQQFTTELQKYYSGLNENNKKVEWTSERILSVIKLIEDYNLAKSQGRRPTNKEYHHARKYDVMEVGNKKLLIMKRKCISDPVIQIISSAEYYQRILDTHIATGHGRRDKIVYALKDKYVVPIVAITTFVKLCKTCVSKKSLPKSGIIVKPLITDDFNSSGQVDFVDFQSSPDKYYKWLLQYQDQLTKFCFLRPLRNKEVKEVAIELLKIFLEVGCPNILQSGNGREFMASVIVEIVSLWPACKIILGGPRYLQCQENIERLNRDISNIIRAWMADNKSTNWSIGCYYAQFHINSSYHSIIAKTPYKALFGDEPKLGLSSLHLSKNVTSRLENKEDLEINFKVFNNNGTVKTSEIPKNINLTEIKTEEQENVPNEKGDGINTIDKVFILNSTSNIHKVPITEKYDIRNSEIKIKRPTEPENLVSIVGMFQITQGNVRENPIIVEEVNSLMCHICNKDASYHDVHAMFGVSEDESYGSRLICNKCVNEMNIAQNKKESHTDLKRAAEKITVIRSKKFKDIGISANVLVEVPKVDIISLASKNRSEKVLEKSNEILTVGSSFQIDND